MLHPDDVIRHASAAAAANAREVHRALDAYLAAVGTDAEPGAIRALRAALVAQATGYEGTAHDGGTLDARRTSAAAALDAWDGRCDDLATVLLPVGGGVRCLASTARTLGYTLQTDGNMWAVSLTAISTVEGERARDGAVLQALSEGYIGEAAARRAVALKRQMESGDEARVRLKIAEAERAAAGMKLAAERERSRQLGLHGE